MSEQMRIFENSRVYWDPSAGRYYKAGRLGSFEAQIITPEDIEAIEAVTVLDEVLGLARPQYRLRQICRIIRMNKLTARIDVATALAGVEKVPPLVEAEVSAEAYSKVDFDLWKNVVHVVLADEATMKAAYDVMNLHVRDAARDLARMENKQIAEELDNATAIAGSDWGAMTSPPTSDNNPFDDILSAITTIQGKGYEPNYMVCHPYVWADFITNSYVKDLVTAGIVSISATGGQFTLPGFPTIRVIVDYACTPNTSAWILASEAPALVLGEGPTEAARYRNERAGYNAYIIRQWLQPKIVLDDAVREITGVHS